MRGRPWRWPTSWRRPSCRCRTRTSPTRWSCCAGWPTTTSPSSATASTAGRPRGATSGCLAVIRHRPGHPARRPDHRATLGSMTPRRTKALEKRLLIITKANSRSTVHRSGYLDYIGFKTFDADGNVIGERRFLGLFSTGRVPHQRARPAGGPPQGRRGARPLRLSPRSHSGKDLLEILETYPRDELFQITTDDLYQAVIGVLRMAGRRQLRLFLRRDAYGRFISCLVYLPRDRFTTQNRLAMQEILLRELNGVGVDYTTRVTESMLARVHFIVRTDPTQPARRGRRRRARRAARRRHPLLGRRLPAGAGAQARRGAGQARWPPGTATRSRGVQGRAHARTRRSRTSPSWSCWRSRASWRCTCTAAPRRDGRPERAVQGLPVRRADVCSPPCLPVLHSLGRAGRRRAAVRGRPRRRHRLPVTTSACDCPGPGARAGRGPRRTWRTPSPPPGAARPRWTGSTSWCCGPG